MFKKGTNRAPTLALDSSTCTLYHVIKGPLLLFLAGHFADRKGKLLMPFAEELVQSTFVSSDLLHLAVLPHQNRCLA